MRLIPVAVLVVSSTIASTATAATFCVGTAQEFQNALSNAASNGEQDVIRLRSGTYAAASGPIAFSYATNQNFDLLVEGGWQNLGQTPCVVRVDDPGQTVLDGGGVRSVLQLQGNAGTTGSLAIRNLTIRNGSGDGFGGLRIRGAAGNATVERVIVRDNASGFVAGGIDAALDGGVLAIRDSLIANNTCAQQACGASLLANAAAPSAAVLLQFTANTVALNSCPASACDGRGGVVLGGTGRAVIANNALFFNEGDDVLFEPGTDLLHNAYESVAGMPGVSIGNLVTATPGFVDALALDFRLRDDSLLVDAGTGGVVMTALDVAGRPRLNGQQFDIGAHELQRVVFVDGFEAGAP